MSYMHRNTLAYVQIQAENGQPFKYWKQGNVKKDRENKSIAKVHNQSCIMPHIKMHPKNAHTKLSQSSRSRRRSHFVCVLLEWMHIVMNNFRTLSKLSYCSETTFWLHTKIVQHGLLVLYTLIYIDSKFRRKCSCESQWTQSVSFLFYHSRFQMIQTTHQCYSTTFPVTHNPWWWHFWAYDQRRRDMPLFRFLSPKRIHA